MIKMLMLLALSVQLFSFDVESASLIFEKIFHAMFQKEKISVYAPSSAYQEVINNAETLALASDPDHADIVLLNEPSELSVNIKNSVVFTTNAYIFSHFESAVGAFYWEHGKPKILFSRQRLEAFNMTLQPQYQKYIVEKLP